MNRAYLFLHQVDLPLLLIEPLLDILAEIGDVLFDLVDDLGGQVKVFGPLEQLLLDDKDLVTLLLLEAAGADFHEIVNDENGLAV